MSKMSTAARQKMDKQREQDNALRHCRTTLETVANGHSVGQFRERAKLLTATQLAVLSDDLIPADAPMGPAGTKGQLVDRLTRWVELRGEYTRPEPKPAKAKKGKAKADKPAKVEPEQAWEDLMTFLSDFSSEEVTGQEMPDLRAHYATLADRLPTGKPADDLTKPTLRNVIEAINAKLSEDETALPVSGPKAKLIERIAAYFGLIDPPAVKKSVAWERLASYSDADLMAELERRRQATSGTEVLIAGGIC